MVPVVERDFDQAQIYMVEEAFFGGSGADVVLVVSTDHYAVGNQFVGRLTRQIQHLCFKVAGSRVSKYRHWLTPVCDRSRAN